MATQRVLGLLIIAAVIAAGFIKVGPDFPVRLFAGIAGGLIACGLVLVVKP